MLVYENFYVFLLVGSNTVGRAMQLQHLQSNHPEKYNIPTNNSMNISGKMIWVQTGKKKTGTTGRKRGVLKTLPVKGIPAGIIIMYKKLTNEMDVQM